MSTIAIIPARGGSKRIPHKNVKDFCGLPIIAYSIRAALMSGCFDEVMVSTDDEEIAEVARSFGASVPFMRSAATSDDFATTADVIEEVINNYENQGIRFETLACIYATAPFVTPVRLRQACDMIGSQKADGVFSCVQYSYPIQRSLEIDDAGRVKMKFPQYALSRSQDLTPSYHDAGQFYFVTVESFRRDRSLWGKNTLPVVLPETEVQDLDTPTDWRIAEMKYRLSIFPDEFATAHYQFRAYTTLPHEIHTFILAERNNPEVRKMMVNTEEILPAQHAAFVENLARATDRQYYAVFDRESSELVASINFKMLTPGVMERGVWVAEAARGKGHAANLIKEAYRWMADNRLVESVVTFVDKENIASRKLEQKLGAVQTNTDGRFIYFTTPTLTQ